MSTTIKLSIENRVNLPGFILEPDPKRIRVFAFHAANYSHLGLFGEFEETAEVILAETKEEAISAFEAKYQHPFQVELEKGILSTGEPFWVITDEPVSMNPEDYTGEPAFCYILRMIETGATIVSSVN
jgi:hypothetical protein